LAGSTEDRPWAEVTGMTMTFHHSGWPPLPVVIRWSWDGRGTLSSVEASDTPSVGASRDRSMVAGWSMQVMTRGHRVKATGGLAYDGTGTHSGSI
jgi:hypothetical protein